MTKSASSGLICRAILLRLGQKGVESAALDVDTYDDDRFFSHRRATHLSQPDSGRLISMIRRSA